MMNVNVSGKLLNAAGRRRHLVIAAAIVGAVAASGLIWYALFAFTSLGNMLPERLDSSMRSRYEFLAMRVDSMQRAAEINSRYADNLLRILADSVDSAPATDTVAQPLPIDSLMEASAAEKRLVERFEMSERFNLSVLTPIVAEGMVFFPPVSGVDLSSNSQSAGMPSSTLSVGADTPVSAVYHGTVIDTYYRSGHGLTLTLQHPNGFISQYDGLKDIFVTKGSKVDTGQRIGMAYGDTMPLTFMMWHNGLPIDAADYVSTPRTPAAPSQSFIR